MASEDMDSLTFATPRLIRNLMKPASQELPVTEYEHSKVILAWRLSAANCNPSTVYKHAPECASAFVAWYAPLELVWARPKEQPLHGMCRYFKAWA